MVERLLAGERQLGGEAYHSSMAQILEATDTPVSYTHLAALHQLDVDDVRGIDLAGFRCVTGRVN